MRTCLLFLALVAFGAIALFSQGNAEAAPAPCTVDIAVEESRLGAWISSTQPGAVTSHGTAQVTKPASVRAVVTISAAISTGWPITVSPATFTVVEGSSATLLFNATVVVPPATLADDVGELGLSAAMTAAGLQCQPSSVEGIIVSALPYFEGLAGSPMPQSITMPTGDGSRTVTVSVNGMANAPIDLTFDHGGPAAFSFRGPSPITLTPESNATIHGNLTWTIAGHGLTEGSYVVVFTIMGALPGVPPKSAAVDVPVVVEKPPSAALAQVAVPAAIVAAAVGGGLLLVFLRKRRR